METMQKIADLENLGIKPIMPGETEEVRVPISPKPGESEVSPLVISPRKMHVKTENR